MRGIIGKNAYKTNLTRQTTKGHRVRLARSKIAGSLSPTSQGTEALKTKPDLLPRVSGKVLSNENSYLSGPNARG